MALRRHAAIEELLRAARFLYHRRRDADEGPGPWTTPEFIKLNFANAEANVRAYDTKSQIVLASTALSFSPILFAIRQLDNSPWVTARLGVLFSLFAIVLLLFLLLVLALAR